MVLTLNKQVFSLCKADFKNMKACSKTIQLNTFFLKSSAIRK